MNTEVICLQHGPMIFRFPLDWWVCVGFDGEGCSVQIVYSEDITGKSEIDIPGVMVLIGGGAR